MSMGRADRRNGLPRNAPGLDLSEDCLVVEICHAASGGRVGMLSLWHQHTWQRCTVRCLLDVDPDHRSREVRTVYTLGSPLGPPIWTDSRWDAPVLATTPWMSRRRCEDFFECVSEDEEDRRVATRRQCLYLRFSRITGESCPNCSGIQLHSCLIAHGPGDLRPWCPC